MASWLNKGRVRFVCPCADESTFRRRTRLRLTFGVNMSACQDTSFCVPVYGQAESASDSQVKDHSGSKQDQEVSGELVPVFCPSWRDKSQTALERRPEGTSHNGSLVSSLSDEHVDAKRLCTENSSADVRLLLQKLGVVVCVTLSCTWSTHFVLSCRNVTPTETPWSIVVKPTNRQT